MTDQLPERIWVPTMPTATGEKIIGGHSDEEVAGWAPFLRADTAVTKTEADAMIGHIESTVGHWLSAALEDPSVCAEMKADVGRFFDATSDARAAFEQAVRDAVEAAKREWALKYLSDESQHFEAIDAAVTAERERCARIVDEYAPNSSFMEDALHHISKETSE